MWRTPAKRRACPSVPRWAARAPSHGSCSAASTTSRSGHTIRSGSHASSSGSIPAAVATASWTMRRGEGKSTFAHTPSARPGLAPSTADIRWVSQRSIPRVGTHTTSGANGSGSGWASTEQSASMSPSARSARWMCSTARPGRYAAVQPDRSGSPHMCRPVRPSLATCSPPTAGPSPPSSASTWRGTPAADRSGVTGRRSARRPVDGVTTTRRAWLMWALGVAAYGIAVFHRASLGVAGPLAQERFGATAAQLSLFIVLQLAVYAALQVPVGVFLDRVGSRRMIAMGAVVMGLGQLVLAESHVVGLAVLGRVLVGSGDAMTFTSVLRLVPAWFEPRRVPLITQLTGIFGQMGQVAAAIPLVALLRSTGWTPAFLGAGLAGVAVAAVLALVLRDAPPHAPPAAPPATLEDVRFHLREAWREPGTRLGLWTHFVAQFSGTVFALLWGYPFL